MNVFKFDDLNKTLDMLEIQSCRLLTITVYAIGKAVLPIVVFHFS